MQTHLKRAVSARVYNRTPEGKMLTQPNRAVNILQALNMYQAGTLENKAKAYYEEQGMPIPNFDMMDKIEKYQALNEFKERAKEKVRSLRALDQKQAENHQKLINQRIEQKADEQLQRSRGTGSNDGTRFNTGDGPGVN